MAQRRVGGAFVLAGLLVGGAAAPAAAQVLSEKALAQMRLIRADKASWTPTERKLASSLLYAHRESLGRPMVQGLPPFRRVTDRARVGRDGMVIVDIRAEVTDGLLQKIADLGGRVAAAYLGPGAVRARLPIREIQAIAELPEVQYVRPQQKFVVHQGSQTTQGDIAHAVASTRTALGIDGTGVKVGVLSDGVTSLADRQASGDLPLPCPRTGACVQVVQECDLTPYPPGTTCGDEGTAMLEIVHDLAPGAKLYFANAIDSPQAFAANILTLRNTYGCDIIVDDVTWLDEGAFQDGVIARAVNTVTASGALFFSSAGNFGRKDAGTSGTWEGDFLDSGTMPEAFAGTEYQATHSFNGLTGASAAQGNELASYAPDITLKWSDPLGGAVNDYDIYVMDADLTGWFDLSTDDQGISRDPFEWAWFNGGGWPGDRIVIALYGHVVTPGQPAVPGGGAARALHLDTLGAGLSLSTAGAIVGHNGGASTISVAATNVSTAGGGTFSGGAANPVETYSSDGPRRMFLNPDGSAITPGNVLFGTNGGRVLQKPDITAADCVVTTTPGFSPFCGTSAAAPHAAAVAALLKSGANHPGGGQVLAAMFATALDVTPGAGWDRNSGVGIVMADAAAGVLTNVPAVDFYTVSPCRVFDTRDVSGATGGAPLTCGIAQNFTIVGGTCGVPSGAKAVSVNLTGTASTAQGNLRLYATGAPAPLASNLNYVAGMNRANNAVAPLSATGQLSVLCSPSGTTHVVLDVNGYFR